MVNKICVCGAGTMGSGIAESSALAGFETILFDIDAGTLQKAAGRIDADLEMLIKKNKIGGGDKSAVLARLAYTTDLNDCKADLIIEAIVEKLEAKQDLFTRLSKSNDPWTVFASNTSSLSISRIAKSIPGSHRVIGMHFFNPAPVMKLVEIVSTDLTDENSMQKALWLAEKMGKTPVQCRDSPGFIVNRVARPYYLEALRLVETGLADFETVDTLMEATGFRMGPFRLMDLIGNDINLAVSRSLYEALDKPERLKPSPVQESRVNQGELGKKNGKGYYHYD